MSRQVTAGAVDFKQDCGPFTRPVECAGAPTRRRRARRV